MTDMAKCCQVKPEIPASLNAFQKCDGSRKMLEKIPKPNKFIVIIPISLLAIFAVSFAPLTHAYGVPNWQVGFAGTGILPGNGGFGFWGWCAFAGGVTSGNEADCQLSTYFHSNPGGINGEFSIHGTAWDMQPALMPPPPGSGLPADDFFITAGTETISGQFGASIISIAGPFLLAAGCTITGNSVTCPLSLWEVLPPGCAATHSCIYSPDTGIPAAAGHYNLNSAFLATGPPGAVGELQAQVTQIS